MSLLELYLRSEGGDRLCQTMTHMNLVEEDPCAYWSSALMPVVTAIAHSLYPCLQTEHFRENIDHRSHSQIHNI